MAKSRAKSKIEKARTIVKGDLSKDIPRRKTLEKLQRRLDMTPAGASTYYQNAKRSLQE